jgi:hypothetical protein
MVVVASRSVSLPRSCLLKSGVELLLPVIDAAKIGPIAHILRQHST